jgi:short-subunit dehydrogenase
MEIKDKVIIITGASMGIGLATARELADQGAKVVLVARSEDRINALSKELLNSLAVVTDMTKLDSIKNLISETMKKYGRIDVLINNAGQGLYGSIEKVSATDYRRIFELNVVGPLVAMQEVIPIMRKQGGGMIINISSMVSKAYYPLLGAYASTKYALNALTLTARQELANDKIIITSVLPSMTLTDFGKNSIKVNEAAQTMTTRDRANMPEPDSAKYIAGRIVLAIETGDAEVYAHDEMEK